MGVKFMSLAFVILVVIESSRGASVGDRVGDKFPGDRGGFVGDKFPGDRGGFVGDKFPGDRGGFVGDKVFGNGGIGGGKIIDIFLGDGRIFGVIDRVADELLRDRGFVDRFGEAVLGDRGIADKFGEMILGGRQDDRFKLFTLIRQIKRDIIDSIRGRVRNIGLGSVIGGLVQDARKLGGTILKNGKLLRDGGALMTGLMGAMGAMG